MKRTTKTSFSWCSEFSFFPFKCQSNASHYAPRHTHSSSAASPTSANNFFSLGCLATQLLPFLEPNSHHEDDPCTVKWSFIKCSPFPEPHSHHDDDPCEMVFFLRCLSSALHSLINCGHDYTIFVPCTVKGSQGAERIGQERSLLYFCCTDTS